MVKLVPFRYRIVILGSMLAAAVVAGSAMSLADTRPVGARALDWAEAGERTGTLPNTLKELEAYPMSFRKAAFRRLLPEERSAVMREHLSVFLASTPLNADQTALVQRLISIATPALYSGTSAANEDLTALKSVCPEIGRLFPESQRSVFTAIGLRHVAPEARYVAWVRKAKSVIGAPVVHADFAMHECDCAEDTMCPDCPANSGCSFGTVPPCSGGTFGCGCLSAWPCEGLCTRIE